MSTLDRRTFLQGVVAAALGDRIVAGPFLRPSWQERAIAPDHFVPVDKKLRLEWLARLAERGQPRVYRGAERLAIGMPVGGIGAGQIYLGGDGTLRLWQIDNQFVNTGYGARSYETVAPARVVDHGFALRVARDGAPVLRRLRDEEVEGIEFLGEYPIGRVRYPLADLGLEVMLEAFAPFVPCDADAATLPVTFLSVRIHNAGAGRAQGQLLTWLENAAARGSRRDFGAAPFTALRELGAARLLHHSARAPERGEAAAPDVFADFEGEGYGAWTVAGDAFGAGPARGAFPSQQPVRGFQGQGLANSYANDDDRTGRLLSPEFEIRRPWINFLIGGGEHRGQTCVNLLVDDKAVRTATGANQEELRWHAFDVAALRGRRARFEIVDARKGAWGHVNVDQIEFADVPRRGRGGAFATQPDAGEMGLLARDAGARLRAEGERRVSERAGELLEWDFDLPPGGEARFRTVLLWHFPNHAHGRGYAARFADLDALARHVVEHADELERRTRLFAATWYDASTLPRWLLARIAAPLSTLATNTVEVWRDGRCYAFEGVGCCEGTCTHVWNYEQGLARLFPALARSTRELQDLGPALGEDGVVGFRGNRAYAADGQAGTVLKVYREHLCSADDAFLRRVWPRARQALEFLIRHDADDDGLIEDRQHNTYDIDFHGANTFVGALYLAALRAGAAMARHAGDAGFAARCTALAERGAERTMARLFNGEYFVQQVDARAHPRDQYGDGCLSDQLFGQNWAHQLGLGYLYPRDAVHKAVDAIWRYNWAPDVGPQKAHHLPERYFARAGEAGLFVCTWPRSRHPGGASVRYRDEVWTGIEWQYASHAIWEGRVQEGLAVVRGIDERYDGRKHNPWNEVECGEHYARALASHGVLLALCGFAYDGPAGVLGFAPRWPQPEFAAFFAGAEGFGLYARMPAGKGWRHRVEVRDGRLALRELRLGAMQLPGSVHVSVRIGEAAPGCTVERTSDGVTVRLLEPQLLRAGQTLSLDCEV
ncbi:MAG: hypothetical protein IT458_09130 [Planctomycetes bacterium]|nr:hypothetical protein [Planctomycetota bacterium]